MTDESQKGTLMSNTITNGNYYYTQSAYVQSAHYYSNQTIGSGDFQSAVLDKDEERYTCEEGLYPRYHCKYLELRIWCDAACRWKNGLFLSGSNAAVPDQNRCRWGYQKVYRHRNR